MLNCLLLAVACSAEKESVSSIHQGLTAALHIQATQAAIEQSFTQCPQETRDAIANMSWQQDTLASSYRDATGNWQHCMRDPGQTNAQCPVVRDAGLE